MQLSKLASAIYNDIVGGLSGYHQNFTISLEQLEDDIIDERLAIIKEYSLKNLIPIRDLLRSINCIEVDCESLDQCPCNRGMSNMEKPEMHFEIPQLLNDFGNEAIWYIGTTDMKTPFITYTNMNFIYNKYRSRSKNKPYVFINTSPNTNNMYDAWIFNAQFIKFITVIAVFKDPRQLEIYDCCESDEEIENYNFLTNEIKRRLTEKKLRFYRQLIQPPVPNDQTYK